MNPVTSYNDVALDGDAVDERNAGCVVILREAGAAVPGMYDLRIQFAREQLDKIGAMHPECGVPARRVGHLDRRDWGAVMAEVMRAGADPRSVRLDQWSQSHSLQLAHAVRR